MKSMYLTIGPKNEKTYYNFTMKSANTNEYVNIYICEENNAIRLNISSSTDGFWFKGPHSEPDLKLIDNLTCEETYQIVKEFYLAKGYELAEF